MFYANVIQKFIREHYDQKNKLHFRSFSYHSTSLMQLHHQERPQRVSVRNNKHIRYSIFRLFGIPYYRAKKLMNPYAHIIAAFSVGQFGIKPAVIIYVKIVPARFFWILFITFLVCETIK